MERFAAFFSHAHQPSKQTNPATTLFLTNSPNALTGQVAAANAQIDFTDPTKPVCTIGIATGLGFAECEYFNDPVAPFIIMKLDCPAGQTALQNGCISGGAEALTGTVQDIGSLLCYVNAPATANPAWIASITATCVDLTITAVNSNKALVSTLPKLSTVASRASIRASFTDPKP